MQSTFINMAVVALLGIAPQAAQAAKPCETPSKGAATLGERQRARPDALAYAETNKLRYAAYYEDAKERCTVYGGQARNICIGEARMKYVQ